MNFKSMGLDGKDGRPQVSPSGGGNFPLMPRSTGLARQSSVYSLTFDEFQNTPGGLGKDFGSMNMDELLKSIWTAEETQAMASAAPMGIPGEGGASATAGNGNGMAGLNRQGSLTLPRTISHKTVDEVWRDLFTEGCGSGQGQPESTTSFHPQQRQPTLGEMTLEEFLVRAGVVRDDITQSVPRTIVTSTNIAANGTGNSNNSSLFYGNVLASNLNSNTGLALGFPPTAQSSGATVPNLPPNNLSRSPFAPPMQFDVTSEAASKQGLRGGGGVIAIGDPSANSGLMAGMAGLGAGGIAIASGSPEDCLPSDGLGRSDGDLPSSSPMPYVFNGGLRGRKCGNAVEKVVERRQRRMIKNRESAARSRARKQAYITELEAEVAKLKEQKQELEKKQAAMLEKQKNQVLEIINQQCGSKKRCLRRTLTGPCVLLHSCADLPEYSVNPYFR